MGNDIFYIVRLFTYIGEKMLGAQHKRRDGYLVNRLSINLLHIG